MILEHRSSTLPPEGGTLDPNRLGENHWTQRDLRESKIPRVYLTVKGREVEPVLEGRPVYHADVPSSEIYDAHTDPLGLVSAWAGRGWHVDHLVRGVRDAGFHGIKWHDGSTVSMFRPVDVTPGAEVPRAKRDRSAMLRAFLAGYKKLGGTSAREAIRVFRTHPGFKDWFSADTAGREAVKLSRDTTDALAEGAKTDDLHLHALIDHLYEQGHPHAEALMAAINHPNGYVDVEREPTRGYESQHDFSWGKAGRCVVGTNPRIALTYGIQLHKRNSDPKAKTIRFSRLQAPARGAVVNNGFSKGGQMMAAPRPSVKDVMRRLRGAPVKLAREAPADYHEQLKAHVAKERPGAKFKEGWISPTGHWHPNDDFQSHEGNWRRDVAHFHDLPPDSNPFEHGFVRVAKGVGVAGGVDGGEHHINVWHPETPATSAQRRTARILGSAGSAHPFSHIHFDTGGNGGLFRSTGAKTDRGAAYSSEKVKLARGPYIHTGEGVPRRVRTFNELRGTPLRRYIHGFITGVANKTEATFISHAHLSELLPHAIRSYRARTEPVVGDGFMEGRSAGREHPGTLDAPHPL